MSAIDVIILGILEQEPYGSYDIQRERPYQSIKNICTFVKAVINLCSAGTKQESYRR
ncbi:hypothetical protein [[Clostridium] fimetarium]|uniref:Uncharacterized protein n=1 Tax=[Clostridium] fimetarium TaxID=99656 RepID=A0A1I0PEM6_9FIRM|nr:hypothetical protein [[Clostridium] fimetarium]SEW12865.1 hypothetical protein SAMN05421659_10534 [[Clostridium] fimetarium]